MISLRPRSSGSFVLACTLALAPLGWAQPALQTPNYEIGSVDGRPLVLRAGRPVSMASYADAILGPGQPQDIARWHNWADHFIASGIKVFYLELGRYKGMYGQSSFWTEEGVYPANAPLDEPLSIDAQAEYILRRVPDAQFLIRLNSYAPHPWEEKNPGDMSTDSDGKRYQPSLASTKYLDGLSTFLRHVTHHYESQPWSSHIIGYAMFPLGEGLTDLSTSGKFYDRSPAMERAWRDYLVRRYHSDEALAKAWNDPDARLSTVTIPQDQELLEKVHALPHWPEPSAMRPERDYAMLQRQLFECWVRTIVDSLTAGTAPRRVVIALDSMKQPLLGWQPGEFFGGGPLPDLSCFLSSGSIGVGPLLDLPNLNGLITPADYTNRSMGFGFEPEGIGDSMVLRGKAMFVENDTRTFVSQEMPDGPSLGTFADIHEVRAGFNRNTASCLSRGFLPYWMDISRGFFNDDGVQAEIRRDKRLLTAGQQWPHRDTEHAIAVIIDDESPLYENFTTGYQKLALLRQRVDGLGLAGVPYRQYLLSDLEKGNFPQYRCYLFPDLFKVDARVKALLQQKVFRNGAVAIFGPGTGITDGETNSAAPAEELLGIPMRLTNVTCAHRVRLRDRGMGALRAANMPPTYGAEYQYGPVLLPDPKRVKCADIQVLGDADFNWKFAAPGLVLKDFGRGGAGNGRAGTRAAGDYAVVFSGAVPLPPALLRSLARYGGCNIWCDDDLPVFASHEMVAIHTNESKSYTIRLPWRPGEIVDAMDGRVVARNTNEFVVRTKAPETRVFRLR